MKRVVRRSLWIHDDLILIEIGGFASNRTKRVRYPRNWGRRRRKRVALTVVAPRIGVIEYRPRLRMMGFGITVSLRLGRGWSLGMPSIAGTGRWWSVIRWTGGDATRGNTRPSRQETRRIEGSRRPIKGIFQNRVSLMVYLRNRWGVVGFSTAFESGTNRREGGLFREPSWRSNRRLRGVRKRCRRLCVACGYRMARIL